MVCFCPFCGGNDVEYEEAQQFDGDTRCLCGDCEKVFTVQVVRLDADDIED